MDPRLRQPTDIPAIALPLGEPVTRHRARVTADSDPGLEPQNGQAERSVFTTSLSPSRNPGPANIHRAGRATANHTPPSSEGFANDTPNAGHPC